MGMLNKIVYVTGVMVTITILVVFGIFAISYGEYMMTITGDIRWALFYVPHVIAVVWYIRRNSKLGN